MFPTPAHGAVAGLAALLEALAFVGFGYLLVDAAAGRRDLPQATRWGLAVPAVAAYALVLMLAHMASGGRVFSRPPVVGGVTLALGGGLLWRRLRGRTGRGVPRPTREALVVGALVLLGLALWGFPAFRLLPLDRRGDVPWHMGFVEQLLNGETTPAALVTGDIPNYYPWLFHAMVALLADLSAGGRAYHGLNPMQLMMVAGTVLALYALGREVTGRWTTGAAAAVFGGLAGGVGFVLLRHLDLVMDPRDPSALRYLGDLFYKRSYNVAFANLSPPFPRDVALLMLVGFLLLLVSGLARRSVPLLAAGGLVLGLGGLANGEAYFVGLAVAAVIALVPPGMRRATVGAALLGPALGVYAIWVIPLFVNFLRLDGFVNITVVGPVDLTPLAIVVSWGISLPFAAYGFLRWFPRSRRDVGARVLAVLLAVSAGLLAASTVARLGGGEAFVSLSRRHRYWPLLHLALALYGALGATEVLDRLARWRRVAAVAVAGAVLAAAVPSPAVASLSLVELTSKSGFYPRSLRGDPTTVLNRALGPPGRRCVAAAPQELDSAVFSYTGYRMVLYVSGDREQNLARIRWKGIYDRIPTDRERVEANAIIVGGVGDLHRWREAVDRFGVDVVVAPAGSAAAPAFRGYPMARAPEDGYVVVWVGDCQGG